MTAAAGLVIACLSTPTAIAAPVRTVAADPDAVAQILSTTVPSGVGAAAAQPGEASRTWLAPDGFLRFVASPPGRAFANAAASTPGAAATAFLAAHARAFGIDTGRDAFDVRSTRPLPGRTFVKLEQRHAGVPVFAGQAMVQLDDAGRVQCVVAEIGRGLGGIDLAPGLVPAEIVDRARRAAAPGSPNDDITVTAPRTMIFAPNLIELAGAPRLVWECQVASEARPEIAARLLIDAHTGEVAARFAMHYQALYRQIYDANSTTAEPGTLVRFEGSAPSSITEANNVYDYLGDTYAFYWNNHGRDGIDNMGTALSATVRRCTAMCPWPNAAWNGGRMRYGLGFTVDDVVGHELTHGVTENESGLLFQNASGAINESLSDIWGEFVDLGNGRGVDNVFVWWDIGEELPGGRLRSMSDPPAKDDPDRLGSSLYVPETNSPDVANDFGGVHTNSGVNNKLCYLLVDGDTFNGQTIQAMGIPRVADLYYEVSTNFLTSGTVWNGLFTYLQQAAVNLGWTTAERNNLYRACQAVEIAVPYVRYVDASSACIESGDFFCSPVNGPFHTLTTAQSYSATGAILDIKAGNYPETLVLDKTLELRANGGIVRIGP
jgi:Zn-dependent metalloprotease